MAWRRGACGGRQADRRCQTKRTKDVESPGASLQERKGRKTGLLKAQILRLSLSPDLVVQVDAVADRGPCRLGAPLGLSTAGIPGHRFRPDPEGRPLELSGRSW